MTKKIFVCSPLREIGGNTFEDNVDLVKRLCRAAALTGNGIGSPYAPFAPHLYCPLFLNDALLSEREVGLTIGREFLRDCNELWVYDTLGISSGMQGDIDAAKELGIKVVMMPFCFEGVLPKRAE